MTALPLYENGRFWVRRADKRKDKDMGFEVYESRVTHSVRCAIIGCTGDLGLKWAIIEADRRANLAATP